MRNQRSPIQFCRHALAVAVAMTTVVQSASANNEGEAERAHLLDQVTVTATRSEKQLKDVVGSVSVTTRETMDKELVRNVRDAMRYEPGVEVGTDNRSGIKGVNIRGMDANRVKIMVDGVDQSQHFDPGFGYISSQRNFIDVDTLKAIEVVKGPASSLYGSDAIGGTVAYMTKDPVDYLDVEGDDSHVELKGGYTSADEGFAETITAANRSGDLETMFVYTRRDNKETENYDGANIRGKNRTRPDPMDSGLDSVLTKVQYQLNDNHRIGTTLEYLNSKSDSDLLTEDASGQNPGNPVTAKDSSKRTRVGIFHEWQVDSPLVDDLRWTLDWQKTEQNQITNMPAYTASSNGSHYNARLKDYDYSESSLTLNSQFNKALNFGGFNHSLVYGFNVSETETKNSNLSVDLDNGVATTDSYIPKVTARNYGIYLQDEIQLSDRLMLTPGIRYDKYSYRPKGNATFNDQDVRDINDGKFTFRLGTIYDLTDNLSVYAQFSQGFKAPGFYEMYFSKDGGSYMQEANPNLRPEESDSWEIGLRGEGRLGSYEITAFYNSYDDFIESTTHYNDPTYPYGVTTYQNIGHATIKGLELRGQLWLDEAINAPVGTSLRFAAAYAEGEDEDSKKPLNSIAPLKGVIGLGYDDISETWGGELAFTMVQGKSRSDIDNSENSAELVDTSGYGLVDMSGYYHVSEQLTVRAGLYNLTDKKYTRWEDVRGMTTNRTEFQRYSQPGRNFGVSVNYVF